jgi:methionine biosynthesis protein MetW
MGYLERIFHASMDQNRRDILATMRPQPGAALLDLGCGDGTFTNAIAEAIGADRMCGIELLQELAERAQEKGIDVWSGDLNQTWPYPDDAFDVVHSNQVIEHVPRTDHFLREIRRVLKPDGFALVSTNNLASWHNVMSLVLGWQPTPCHVSDEIMVGNPANPAEGGRNQQSYAHLRIFTGRALSQLAEHHGLRVDLARTSGYYPLPPDSHVS